MCERGCVHADIGDQKNSQEQAKSIHNAVTERFYRWHSNRSGEFVGQLRLVIHSIVNINYELVVKIKCPRTNAVA